MRRALRILMSMAMPASVVVLVVVPSGPALAVQTPQDRLVATTPVDWTPSAVDGSVQAIIQIGNTVIMGGDFTQVQAAGSTTVLEPTQHPRVQRDDGRAEHHLPAPDRRRWSRRSSPRPTATSVYVGGQFHTVNGKTTKSLTELSLSDGTHHQHLQDPSMNGKVKDLRLAGGQLWVAGSFTTIGGVIQTGLVTLNPTTGAVTPLLQQQRRRHLERRHDDRHQDRHHARRVAAGRHRQLHDRRRGVTCRRCSCWT